VKRLLVDTHALLWWLTDDRALSAGARELMSDGANELRVSAASIWEIAIKRGLGRLEAPDDLPAVIEDEGFAFLPVGPDHAWEAGRLPDHHRDPFDRVLVAQARVEALTLLTADEQLRAYGVPCVW
jgi:PIN domain nuclease of toxin-antitoxin system